MTKISGANYTKVYGGQNFLWHRGKIFLRRYAKSPVSAPPIEVNSCTKMYYRAFFACTWYWTLSVINETNKMTKFVLESWRGGDGPQPPNWRHWTKIIITKGIYTYSMFKMYHSVVCSKNLAYRMTAFFIWSTLYINCLCWIVLFKNLLKPWSHS